MKEINGDAIDLFLNTKQSTFLHGCNCLKTMGAGIAKQVKKQLPDLFHTDMLDERRSSQRLGSYSYAHIDTSVGKGLGVNLYTQYDKGANFDINALTNSLRALRRSRLMLPNIYLPKIGSGIGGGSWNEIKKVIEKELKNYNTIVVNYQPYKTYSIEKMEDGHTPNDLIYIGGTIFIVDNVAYKVPTKEEAAQYRGNWDVWEEMKNTLFKKTRL